MNALALWLAQGFGLGRIPVAPGTFGSLAGLLWFALLTSRPTAWVFTSGLLFGIGASVVLTGVAERLLGRKDPNSVVLDEIVAVPACFIGWTIILFHKRGHWPTADFFFNAQSWFITAGVMVVFRIFDVVKPWPLRQAQSLPGGWGITVDDVLAALYVNVCVLAVFGVKPNWFY